MLNRRTVADERKLAGYSATLSVTMRDQNGTAADAQGAVTVGVTRADGTQLLAAGTATTHGATASGIYTVNLTAAQASTLDLLTAAWTDAGDGSVTTTVVELVGGFFFSVADARASDPTIADAAKYSDATILATRKEVEEECEWICDCAFVPRYRRVVMDGTGTRELVLPDRFVRTIRDVRVYTSPTAYTPFTADQLANLNLDGDNKIERINGSGYWTEGRGNITVGYEYGLDRPPADLKRAALWRLRSRLNFSKSGIPDRATSYVAEGGGNFRLDMPDAFKTGIPEVDAAYSRYSQRPQGGAAVAASRRLDFDPQYYSLFHAGPR